MITAVSASRWSAAADACDAWFDGSTWIVMADPEGNEFCICDGGNPSSPTRDGDH